MKYKVQLRGEEYVAEYELDGEESTGSHARSAALMFLEHEDLLRDMDINSSGYDVLVTEEGGKEHRFSAVLEVDIRAGWSL